MTRSRQLLIVVGAPVLIVVVMALSALLAVRLAATQASPGTPAIQDRALDATPDRGKTTPVRLATATITRPISTLAPTVETGASRSSSLGASCCALTPAQPEETALPRATTEMQAGVAIETLDGATFRVATQRDQVVAVVSMAVGCASCIQELRGWAEILPGYRVQDIALVVLSINPFEDAETLKRVLATVGVSDAIVAIDRDGEVSRALGIQTLDQTLIFDRAGQMTFSDAVPTSASTLEEAIDQALAG